MKLLVSMAMAAAIVSFTASCAERHEQTKEEIDAIIAANVAQRMSTMQNLPDDGGVRGLQESIDDLARQQRQQYNDIKMQQYYRSLNRANGPVHYRYPR